MTPHRQARRRREATVSMSHSSDALDREIFDAVTEFFGQLVQRGEKLADRFGVPVSCLKALRRVDEGVTMEDLGQLLHCDRSVVTMIADSLEERGLARREPHAADRRIKNLVLTARGLEVKAALEQEAHGMMPWSRVLDRGQREQVLEILCKMRKAMAQAPRPASREQ